MITERFAGLRADLAFIAHWVTPGARVLDLGCGDGAMMEYLQAEKSCTGYGVEIDDAEVDDFFLVLRGEVAQVMDDVLRGGWRVRRSFCCRFCCHVSA